MTEPENQEQAGQGGDDVHPDSAGWADGETAELPVEEPDGTSAAHSPAEPGGDPAVGTPTESVGTPTEPAAGTTSAGTPSAGTPAEPAVAPSAGTPAEPAPAVHLEALGLRGSRGWAFRDVDLVAQRGDLVVITGASGTGRSALLLAIAGRLKPTTGSLQVAGQTLAPDRPNHRALKQVRERVAVARISHHISLDGDLPVAVNVRDAADWSRQRPADLQDRIDEWRERSGLTFEPHTPVAELPALEVTALHLLLAAVVGPDVIVLDDAAAGLVPTERDRLWQLTAQVAATGPTVIVTTTDVPPEADVHLVLHRHTGPAAHVASSPPADAPETPHSPADDQPEGAPDDQPEGPVDDQRPQPPEERDQPDQPDTAEPDHAGPDEPDQPDRPDQPGTDRDGTEK